MRANAIVYGCEDWPYGLYDQGPPSDSSYLSVTDAEGTARLLARVVSDEKPHSSWTAPISSRFCAPPEQLFDFQANLVTSVHQYTDNLRMEFLARVEKWVGQAQHDGATGAEAVNLALFGGDGICDGVIPGTIQKNVAENCGVIELNQPCQWYLWLINTGECAAKQVTFSINSTIIKAYDGARVRFKASWEERQSHLSTQMEDTGAATIAATDWFLDLYLEGLEATAVSTIEYTLRFWTVVSWIVFGWTISVIAKIFLYILARLSFSPSGGGLGFAPRPRGAHIVAIPDIQWISHNAVFRIPLEQESWFACRSGTVTWDDLQPLGMPRPDRLPFFKRILVGKILWMKYRRSATRTAIAGNHSINFPVAEVKLPLHACLVIDLGRLEAFSEGVRLRTIFSARLSAFLQRQLFFTVACGPGSIILSGREGKIWNVGQGDGPGAVDVQTVIAMDCYGLYGCLSETDPNSLLLNPPTIHPRPDSMSMLVATAKPRGARAWFGWMRYIIFFAFG